jgi:pyruvate dehydrogenase E2 component (dihydrolipoamide acetyltransferase)
MFGVEQFTPIITPPQVAVLGVGAVIDGRCHLSLTFDHKAVDGAPAARYLNALVIRLMTFDGR